MLSTHFLFTVFNKIFWGGSVLVNISHIEIDSRYFVCQGLNWRILINIHTLISSHLQYGKYHAKPWGFTGEERQSKLSRSL